MFQDETCQRRRPRGYRKKLNLSSPYPSPGAYFQLNSGGSSYEVSDMGEPYPYPPQYDYTTPTGPQFASAPGTESWNYVDQYAKVQSHIPMQENNNPPLPRSSHPHVMHPHQHPGSPSHHHLHHQPNPTTNIIDYGHHGYSGYPSSAPYGSMESGK